MMTMKHTMAILAVTTIAANAAVTVTSASSSGNILTVHITGSLDQVGTGDELNGRRLLWFADKRLGASTTQPDSYDAWFGGASNSGHTISGSIGGVDVGTVASGTSGLSTAIPNGRVGIRRDGNDSSAGDVRGWNGSAGPVDYLVMGFGDNADGNPIDPFTSGTAVDLTISMALDNTANAMALNTPEAFAAAFALYAGDGNNQNGINSDPNSFTELVAVPEPSSFALLGLGGLALSLRRRK